MVIDHRSSFCGSQKAERETAKIDVRPAFHHQAASIIAADLDARTPRIVVQGTQERLVRLPTFQILELVFGV